VEVLSLTRHKLSKIYVEILNLTRHKLSKIYVEVLSFTRHTLSKIFPFRLYRYSVISLKLQRHIVKTSAIDMMISNNLTSLTCNKILPFIVLLFVFFLSGYVLTQQRTNFVQNLKYIEVYSSIYVTNVAEQHKPNIMLRSLSTYPFKHSKTTALHTHHSSFGF
jgi:hypothetical protein